MRNIVISTFVLLLVLTGCSTRQHQYRVGVSQCLDDAWRQKMNEEMDRELLLHPEMTLTRRVAYGSNEIQCAQIDSFIQERVDLLIVSPNEAEAVKPAVSRAYRAGIPVIVADRRVTGNEWTAFIGGDNYRVGELMAEWVNDIQADSPKPIHVLEVTGLPGSTPATKRHQGMVDALSCADGKQPQVESVVGAWYQEDAYHVVLEYLRSHKKVDVIVAQNDLMAIGASEAVRDSKGYGKGSVRIMGVDGIMLGLQAVADGVIECTATYPSCGDLVIETAAHILAGESFLQDTVLETMMVDAKAAHPLLMQYRANMHDLETLHIVQLQSETLWKQVKKGKTIFIVSTLLGGVFFLLALVFLLYSQRTIKKEIKKDILPQLEEVQEAIQLSKRDEVFAERMKEIVDEHLTDPDLNVEYLGSAFALSRTQIFRRVKAITGKGPLDYIRERRLVRADELLRTTDMTVQQVALELCFSSPGYFTK